MKKILRLLCGCMMITLAACTGDELTQVADTQNPDATRVVTVKAYTPSENPDSRLAFTENDDQSLSLSWSEGDAFTVVIDESEYTFSYNEDNGTFTSTIPENTEIPDGTEAYYPHIYDDDNLNLSAQNGELNADYTYMKGIYDASANSFQFSHSTAILKATFTTGLTDYEVKSFNVKAGDCSISITDLSQAELENGIYIYLPALAQNEEVVFNANMFDNLNYVSRYYKATQTVKLTNGIEAGKIYHASIGLIESCVLPGGTSFYQAIQTIENYSYATSIVFEANSEETGGTQLASSLAYAKIVDNNTLKVYTEQPEFVFRDCYEMFSGFLNITSIDFGNDINTSGVTDMKLMFRDCQSLTTLDLSNFDTSSVLGMNGMFSYCSNLTTLDLSNFDTSSVTDMNGMFSYCSNLTTLDLSNFDTSSVTDMNCMFMDCKNLASLDLSSFTFADEVNLNYMLYNVGANATDQSITIWVNEQASKDKLEDSEVTEIDFIYAKIEVKTE